MKKRSKQPESPELRHRVVTYLGDDMFEWLQNEASKLAMKEAPFVRYLINQVINKQPNQRSD